MEPFLTSDEVAQRLGMAPRTIARWAREGHLPAHPISGTSRRTWRFLWSEVEKAFPAAQIDHTIGPGVQAPAEIRTR
jgi:excisionase family DNA binding protein